MPNKNNSSKKKPSVNGGLSAVVAISLVGVFVIGFIFLLAKGLFTSNSEEVPMGIDTATINTDKTNKKVEESSENKKEDSSLNNNSENSSDSKSDVNSGDNNSSGISAESGKKMYITQYAYLHTKPDKNAENVVCMSPGVEVTVLNEEDNGYVKITFMNIDGQLTGYIYKDYLTSYDSQVNNAENNAQNIQTYASEQNANVNYSDNGDTGNNNYNYENAQTEQNQW